ncbi:MAG: murein transglycosylase A [Alphaproteobacteria bacterium]|nr:murein transglycosylase A [Alphaproteobacteria bacterium]
MRASKTLGVAVLLLVAACKPLTGLLPDKSADELVLKRAAFADLNGWASADVRSAFVAFVGSCKRITVRVDGDALGGTAAYGKVGEWRAACAAAVQVKAPSAESARQFFEAHFVPAQAFNRAEPVGLFTGYYEPELAGSRKPGGRFTTPLYARPADLVSVDLGSFRPALKGERIAGRVDGDKLVPYDTRAAIESGALKDRSAPIAYVDDAAAAFFLHVQGSGRVRFADGSVVRVAYDGQNGHPYTAVGRVLVERGEIAREALSMQTIRAWLKANPKKAPALMNENASFVFFKEQALDDPTLGAEGAQGVPLTSEASLAVDLRFHALGAPMWVDGTAPADDEKAPDVAFSRLMVAQDTGGAIRGPVRGDVYWGSTARAESVAGRMAHKGQLYVFVPKAVAARLN